VYVSGTVQIAPVPSVEKTPPHSLSAPGEGGSHTCRKSVSPRIGIVMRANDGDGHTHSPVSGFGELQKPDVSVVNTPPKARQRPALAPRTARRKPGAHTLPHAPAVHVAVVLPAVGIVVQSLSHDPQ
jgi:hypothetical protein